MRERHRQHLRDADRRRSVPASFRDVFPGKFHFFQVQDNHIFPKHRNMQYKPLEHFIAMNISLALKNAKFLYRRDSAHIAQ